MAFFISIDLIPLTSIESLKLAHSRIYGGKLPFAWYLSMINGKQLPDHTMAGVLTDAMGGVLDR
jgi:hypothetical protein